MQCKFTVQVAGKLLEPVTTLDINADLSPAGNGRQGFPRAEMYFSVREWRLHLPGLADLHKSLPPDWFEITGANTAKFLGKNAIYKATIISMENIYMFSPNRM